ncbi:uncharacterized protein LOC102800940 [Saccoglossus kowalevskii]
MELSSSSSAVIYSLLLLHLDPYVSVSKPEIIMDSNFMDAAKEEKARKEKLQCRHYFMLNELQNMSRDLKGYVSIFRNAPFNATLGHPPVGTPSVYCTWDKREACLKFKILPQIKNPASEDTFSPLFIKFNIEQDLELRIEEETKRMDQRLILELDQRVSEQQVTLERAGVAGFYVTNNQQEVRLQMHMLDMIVRLSKVELPDL